MSETFELTISDEVRAALAERRPVVALESTIITHGMPYPDNVEMAVRVESIVRAGGAAPATIAVVDGIARAGLDAGLLERLGKDRTARKAATHDLAATMVSGGTAGTTVSATMRLAALAGIRVFATGGIGGVHRGVAESWDISADLTELGRTPVAVVSAGVKSILDIAKTLEVLETNQVPVVGFQTDDFPAFFARKSGEAAPIRLDSAKDIARLMRLHWGLAASGILVANPVPEADALESSFIDGIIIEALEAARQAGISGKGVTPFLLERINAISGGASLKANLALVDNNARLAADIASAYAGRSA